MAGTRSSARLAKVKGKQAEPVKDPDDQMVLDEASMKAESDYDASEDEEIEVQLPPRKRQRTSPKSAKAQTHRKPVNRKGRLAELIASYLLPLDIISLSRANKSFRNLLMHRSSSHLWHSAMRNVRGLPPCPPDLSEPHYLSLLFSKHCTMCGQVVRCRMDEILRVRLCVPCREEHLIALDNIAWDLRSLVHHSGKIIPSKRRWGPDTNHALKEEVREVEQRHQELRNSGDEAAILNWEVDQRSIISTRLKEAIMIQEFLDTIENDRGQELRDLKNARRRDIENRLSERGWDKKDMQFTYNFPARKGWYSLVERPKPLTERIWSNLLPKLIPILEANREARLQKERSERQSARRNRLIHLLNEIKKSRVPLLDITIRTPTASESSIPTGLASVLQGEASSNDAAGTSTNPSHVPQATSGSNGAAKPPTHTIFHAIFPDIVDALEWPLVKAFHETDTSVDEMEQTFVEHRNEIDEAIADWVANAHTHMAEMLRQGQDVEGESLVPRLIVQKDDSDPFANLSDDLKLLLRADSFFVGTKSDAQRRFVTSYDVAVTRFGYGIAFRDGMMTRPYRPPLDLTRVRACGEARRVARVLLASMGLENASATELKSVGRGYACGRCHDAGLKTWEELVSHFVEAKEVFSRVQEHADQLETLEITYRDVHSPELFSDRPLVKYTPEQNGNLIRVCTVCSKDPIAHNVKGAEVKILQHLRDVHDITEPKLGTHYSHSTHPHLFELESSFNFDFEIDAGMFFSHLGDSDSDTDPFWEGDWW